MAPRSTTRSEPQTDTSPQESLESLITSGLTLEQLEAMVAAAKKRAPKPPAQHARRQRGPLKTELNPIIDRVSQGGNHVRMGGLRFEDAFNRASALNLDAAAEIEKLQESVNELVERANKVAESIRVFRDTPR